MVAKIIYSFVLTLFCVVAIKCCEQTFSGATIDVSNSFLHKEGQELKITGCIKSTPDLKNTLQIEAHNQKVPVLKEGAIQNFEWLHVINLKENGIKEIKPKAFLNLKTITDINLAKNELEEIPEGVFNKLPVKKLSFEHNKISKIASGAFNDIPELTSIDFSHNHIEDWKSEWFTNTPKIRLLMMSFNQIEELPTNAFKNFKYNGEDGISVFLDNNKIKKIYNKAFKGLKNLHLLYLAHNEISDVDAKMFSGIESIDILNLSQNKIKCISEDVLDSLPSFNQLDLDSNPLDCKCLKNIQNWAKKHKKQVKMIIRFAECMQERIENVLDSVKKNRV